MSSGRQRAAKKDEKFGEVKNFWGDPAKYEEYKKRRLKLGEAGALYRRDCKFCGVPLGFGVTFDGKHIPLDLRAPVYCVTGEKDPGEDSGVVRTHLAFVNHWATCTKWREAKASQENNSEAPPVEPEPT